MKIQHLINNWPGTINHSEEKVLAIRKVSEENGWLGNMSAFAVRVEGLRYATAEHLFQCMRFQDEEIRREIRETKSAMHAKMVAKKYRGRMSVEAGSERDLDLMRAVLRIKLSFHGKLREQLLRQDADSIIIEDCTKRSGISSRFWGMKLVNGEWVGENWLGRLWMELRLDLQGVPSFRQLDTDCFPGSLWGEVRDYFSGRLKLAA
jgi:hypothetical protein